MINISGVDANRASSVLGVGRVVMAWRVTSAAETTWIELIRNRIPADCIVKPVKSRVFHIVRIYKSPVLEGILLWIFQLAVLLRKCIAGQEYCVVLVHNKFSARPNIQAQSFAGKKSRSSILPATTSSQLVLHPDSFTEATY
jgi:hypothetical protein